MFEVIVFLLLVIFALFIFLKREKSIDFYPFFSEEKYFLLNKDIKKHNTEFYLYTIAEFSETATANQYGVVKELGFSDFIIAYDKILKKFMTARVRIFGTDGYDQSEKLGFYKYLSEEKDWVEINIRMRLGEYNEFFSQLKELALERRESRKNNFFLYDLRGSQVFAPNDDLNIFFLDSIRMVKVYNEYYADKIGFMGTLVSPEEATSKSQLILRSEIADRFHRIVSQ